jgi:rsbT antagonist protein RsbS
MSVAILRQGDFLIASVRADLTDAQVLAFRDDLSERVGDLRIKGIVIDVGGMDVIDSFAARSLRSIAITARLRGAATVLVGLRPEVAIAIVQFDLNLQPLEAVLDLDEAVELLNRLCAGEGTDAR